MSTKYRVTLLTTNHAGQYQCGGCMFKTHEITTLHLHLQGHPEGGSYYYNSNLKIAFPKYDTTCSAVQTDHLDYGEHGTTTASSIVDGDFQNEKSKSKEYDLIEQEVKVEKLGDDYQEEKIESISNIETDTVTSVVYNENLACFYDQDKVDNQSTVKDESTTTTSEVNNQHNTDNMDKEMIDSSMIFMGDQQNYSSMKIESFIEESKDSIKNLIESKDVFETNNSNLKSRKLRKKKALYTQTFQESSSENEEMSTVADEDVTDEYQSTDEKEELFCKYCKKKIKSVQLLKAHIAKFHSEETMTNIKPINKAKKRSTWSPKHVCLVCDSKEDSKPYSRSALKRHIETEHSNDYPSSKCSNCSTTLISEIDKHHHEIKHKNTSLVKAHKIICLVCSKEYKNKRTFDSHMKYHHEKITKSKNFICEICGLNASSNKELIQHMRTHSGEKPLVCELCGFATAHPCALRLHRKNIHTHERNFVCNMCDKTFVTSCSLQRHVNVHMKIQPHVCNQCNKTFSEHWNLKAHMRQHTGERPYKCLHCGMGFAHNVVRKKHEAVCREDREKMLGVKAENAHDEISD